MTARTHDVAVYNPPEKKKKKTEEKHRVWVPPGAVRPVTLSVLPAMLNFTHSIPEHDVHTKLPTVMSV